MLDLVSLLANRSTELGSISSTATNAMLGSMSNIIGAGILEEDGRRRMTGDNGVDNATSSSYTSQLEAMLGTLNEAIAASLVPGEDPVTITSGNLGMTNGLISANVLGQEDVVVAVATASNNDGEFTPTFSLPRNLLDGTGEWLGSIPVARLPSTS